VAGLAAVALIAVLVVALAGGGSSGGDAASGARLAPAGAPLQDQLRGLDRAIDAAR
jgi:hypothetical protein